jgi:hypothetical protein
VSVETDAQAYTGIPPSGNTEQFGARKQVADYRDVLAQAARSGTLSDERGQELAAAMLGVASVSPSAMALVAFERALHGARGVARSWSGGKTDRDSRVLALESVADEAAERLHTALVCLQY